MPIPDVARPHAAPPLPPLVDSLRDELASVAESAMDSGDPFRLSRTVRAGIVEEHTDRAVDAVAAWLTSVPIRSLIAAVFRDPDTCTPRRILDVLAKAALATAAPEASASGTESTLKADRSSLSASDTWEAQDGTGHLSGPSGGGS